MNYLTIFMITTVLGLTIGSEHRHVRITRSSKGNDEEDFNIGISEKGVHFNETMKIKTMENTVFFRVPTHNDVSRSEVLMDFDLNLIITRLLDARLCHIKPLDVESSPSEMESDMQFVSMKELNNTSILHGTALSSTEWALDKLLKKTELPPSVVRFCGAFPVYSLKKVDEDGMLVTELESPSRKKRQTNFQFCPNSYSNIPCNPNLWILKCKFVTSGSTCVYWAKCKLPVGQLNSDLKNCYILHNWSAVMCCVPECP